MQLSKITSFITNVSIDVIGGAVLSTAFAACLLGVALPLWYFVAFSGAVWVMYTLDHLTDAYLLQSSAMNARHRFHQKHFRPLVTILLAVSLLVLFIVLNNASHHLIMAGMILAALSLIHLFLVSFDRTKNSWFVQKELMVALVYTSGVWIGPAIIQGKTPAWDEMTMLGVFGTTVWIEGAMMAYTERAADMAQKTPSIVSKIGPSKSKNLIRFIGILLILISISFMVFTQGQIRFGWMILLIMNILLQALQQSKNKIQSASYFHLLGELIFWLPGLIILF